jgi:hypothetical protein
VLVSPVPLDGIPPRAAATPAPLSDLRRLPRWRQRLDIDAPTALAVAARVVQLAAAPVTLVLMARAFAPEVQGYYFTFASLLALQSFAELGFSIVVTNVASHEWAHLSIAEDGAVVGSTAARSRLHGLLRLVVRWYAAAALIFFVGVSLGGGVLLSRSDSAHRVEWQGPWIAVVALSACVLWLSPLYALLDGCNQYFVTNRFRLAQAVLASAATWAAILGGAGLWTAAAAAGVNVTVAVAVVGVRYRRFFRSLADDPGAAGLDWKREVWPMQWRLAVSGATNYLTFSLYNPVMFVSQGAVAAGQMGMTLAAMRGLQLLGQSWIDTQVAHFGGLIARRDFDALDALFIRRMASSLAVIAAGGVVFLGLVVTLGFLRHPLAHRMLDPVSTAILLVGALLTQMSTSLSIYLRAHKQERVMVLSVVTSLAIAGAVWLLGSRLGAPGAAAGSTAVWFLNVVWNWRIWTRCRREWHAVPGSASG